ncbi:protein-L-histidine N-pros-methyltransferase-like [Branchiostoma floridae x Branchiostoma belcheri]
MWSSSHIRNPLARSLYMQAVRQAEIEEELRDTRYEEWYSCNVSLLSETLQPKYLPLHFDTETEEFLQGSREKSDWVFTQIFHSVVSTLLSMFVSVTSINGWLGRGSMFVFSQQHFYKLMRISPGWQAQKLLDLGAGDGNVTRVMAGHFQEVFVTEQSPPCSHPHAGVQVRSGGTGACVCVCVCVCGGGGRGVTGNLQADPRVAKDCIKLAGSTHWVVYWTLSGQWILPFPTLGSAWRLGYRESCMYHFLVEGVAFLSFTVVKKISKDILQQKKETKKNNNFFPICRRLLDIEEWPTAQSGLTYDLISCLNLLDRCDKPRTVLEEIRRSLSPDGHLILAVVLPYSPCVESGSKLVDPTEVLPVEGKGWEKQANSFVEQVLTPSGFEVETFSRLPYLCEGDLYHPYYVLHDAVFVLRATEPGIEQDNRV